MPSAQIINFGEDPYANAMGNFAKSFLGTLNEKAGQRRNEELFDKIKSKYGKNAKAEDILRDVIESNQFDPSYKKDLVGDIKQLAELQSKKNKNTYDEAVLEVRRDDLKQRTRANDIAEDRVQNQNKEIQNKSDENSRKKSNGISSYNEKL